MKTLIISLTLLTSFTTYGAEMKFEVEASAVDTDSAAMHTSMGKSWVNKEAKKNLLINAKEQCDSLKADFVDLNKVGTHRIKGGMTYVYKATGVVTCDVKEVGRCALNYQTSNPNISTSYLTAACEMESQNRKGMINCFKSFQDRPDDNSSALAVVLAYTTTQVGEAEFALCEHAVKNNFDILYTVLLKNSDVPADELLINLHGAIEKSGYEKTKKTMLNFLRSNDIPDSRLVELL